MTENFTVAVKKKRAFRFKREHLCIPYGVFLALFVIFPLALIVYYAFTAKTGEFTFNNLVWFFSTWSVMKNLLTSIAIGVITTIVCLLLAYPVAYILSKMPVNKQTILLLLFIMPMWINFMLRALAMKELLNIFGMMGKYNYLNVVIGMVYDYLPFMVLPIYTVLIKIDKSYEEAALDLGASKARVFLSVTLPLSLPGILSGITMVFLPSMTCYVISDTFGYGNVTIIGKLIDQWFAGSGSDWHYGSIIALVMLVIMFISTLLSGGFKSENNSRGTAL